MLIHKSNWNVSSFSFSGQVHLAVRPSSCNYYCCHASAAEARALSNAVINCAACVGRRCGGWYDGIFWRSSYKSLLDIGSCEVVAVESCSTGVRLTISRKRSYSITIDLSGALELACQLWVHSQPTGLP